MPMTKRAFLKHTNEPTTYAVEMDDDGLVLSLLDVTSEITNGGLCSHILASLPLAGRVDDLELMRRTRDEYDAFEPDCGNAHHLIHDLIALEQEYRRVCDAFALADSKAKSLKDDMNNKRDKVHSLVRKIADRKPLPLFDGVV